MIKETKPDITRSLIFTALLIAMAVILRNASTMIYFLGAPGMRITFSPIFARMPAILFGPLYGGIAGGIVDVIGFLLRPEGDLYIPLLTLTAILDGVFVGFLWNILKKYDNLKIQKFLCAVFIIIGAVGAFNYVNTVFFPQSSISLAIDAVGNNKGFLVLGLVAVSVAGLILLAVDYAIQKKFPKSPAKKYYLKVLFIFEITGVIITVLNTWILQKYFPELGKIAFVVFLIPRLVKEVFMMVILSYIVAFLLYLYERLINARSGSYAN